MIFNVFVASQREICTIFSLGTPPQTHGNIDLLLKFLHLHRCWQIFSSWCRFFLWYFSWFLVTKEPNVSSQLHVKPIIQTAPWDGSRHLPSCWAFLAHHPRSEPTSTQAIPSRRGTCLESNHEILGTSDIGISYLFLLVNLSPYCSQVLESTNAKFTIPYHTLQGFNLF